MFFDSFFGMMPLSIPSGKSAAFMATTVSRRGKME
jgi:hypothetical protein